MTMIEAADGSVDPQEAWRVIRKAIERDDRRAAAAARHKAGVSAGDRAMAEAIMQGIAPTIAGLVDRISELERRIEQAMAYKGIHEQGATYKKGDVITRNGSWFIAQCTTDQMPGHSDHWRLCVKGK
jgi:Pyruvate/2-oxoacid:ferredoxin oxidoreductase gamma subunit